MQPSGSLGRGFDAESASVGPAGHAGLPGDSELWSALMAYLEWGTRLAFENSRDDAASVQQAPNPRWGWVRHLQTSRSEPASVTQWH